MPNTTTEPVASPPPVIDLRDFPEEFHAWLQYLEYADPDAYALFLEAAGIPVT